MSVRRSASEPEDSAIVRTMHAAALLRDAGCPPTGKQLVDALDVAMSVPNEPETGENR